MNKKIITLLLATVGTISLSSCRKKNPDLSSSVTKYDFPGTGYVDKDYLSIKSPLMRVGVNETKAISLETFPNSYSSQLVFESKNANVVTVNESGEVKGIAKGVADVLVKNKSGDQLGKVRVAVTGNADATAGKAIVEDITADYASSEAPVKVIEYEYSYELYKEEGVLDHGLEDVQIMAYDSEDGVFYIEGPSLYYKTKQGVPDITEGKWVFYTINEGLFTRFLHITPTGNRYWDLNTAEYDSYDRIIRDCLNFFFVSGEKILDNLIADYYGKEDFLSYTDKATLYPISSDTIYYSRSSTGSDKITPELEIDYVDIPAGTEVSIETTTSNLNQGTRCTALDYYNKMSYVLNGKNCSREFGQHKVFDGDFSFKRVESPDKNGYKEVFSLYDL